MLLVLLISFGTVCAVLFSPALPEIARFFHVSKNSAQWTMTLFLLGYALGQLPYGVLANRFGRVPTIKMGITLQLLGCLLCIISYYLGIFSVLLLGRFIMALGASVGLMMSFTLMNDFYDKAQARIISSKLMMAFAILPGLSLTMGGCITHYFAWQYCFYFLLGYGLFVYFIIGGLLEEPVFQKSTELNIKTILNDFAHILKNKSVVLYALMMGGGGAIIYSYNAMSPFLGIDQLNLTEAMFGIFAMLPPLGIFLGSFITQKLNKYFQPLQVIQMGIAGAFMGALGMLVSFKLQISLIGLFGVMFLIYISLSLVLANASALSSGAATDKANASSVMNFLNMSMGALGVGVAQCLPVNWSLALPIVILSVLGCMALLALYLNQSRST
tara:strand:- start:193841 stop:194998 length:1158 start_codon:yes stop_codon:yes gene_type:complete